MVGLEFKEITPEQDNWITQKVLYGYDGVIRLGSLFVEPSEESESIYGYEIDGQIYELPDSDYCETWQDAERVFLEVMFDYFDDKESYYNELKHMCNQLVRDRYYI